MELVLSQCNGFERAVSAKKKLLLKAQNDNARMLGMPKAPACIYIP